VAEVLTNNQASNACFSRAGFVQEAISPDAPPSRAVNRWRALPPQAKVKDA
jgi:RimJ/RimL family protein N-acetyltransferase